jgi:hypothetical protein
MTVMSISIQTLKEAISLKEEIAALESRLSKILGGGDMPAPSFEPAPVKRGRKQMSASARARIAAAKKAWWAKQKGTSVAEPVKRKKGGMAAEGRERIAAAQRARWAKLKGTIYS